MMNVILVIVGVGSILNSLALLWVLYEMREWVVSPPEGAGGTRQSKVPDYDKAARQVAQEKYGELLGLVERLKPKHQGETHGTTGDRIVIKGGRGRVAPADVAARLANHGRKIEQDVPEDSRATDTADE